MIIKFGYNLNFIFMFNLFFNGYFPFSFQSVLTVLLSVFYLLLNRRRGGFCLIVMSLLFVFSLANLIYLKITGRVIEISRPCSLVSVMTLLTCADLHLILLMKGKLVKGNLGLWRTVPLCATLLTASAVSVLLWSGTDIAWIRFISYLVVIIKILIILKMLLKKVNITSVSYFLQDRCALFFTGSASIMLVVYAMVFMFEGSILTLVLTSLYLLVLLLFVTKVALEQEKYPVDVTNHIIEEDLVYTQYGLNSVRTRLLYLFESEKPYLSPNLSINDVAQKLYTNTSYLSRLLNNMMDVNFNEFINNYRIKEAMRLFKEDTSLSLKELCDKSGFRNSSSFNNAFRLNTGYTPGEWCRKVKRGDD